MAKIKIQLDNKEEYTLPIDPRHRNHKFTLPVNPHRLPRFVDILDPEGYPIEIENDMDREFVAQLLSFGLDILLIAAANYEVKEQVLRQAIMRNRTGRE